MKIIVFLFGTLFLISNLVFAFPSKKNIDKNTLRRQRSICNTISEQYEDLNNMLDEAGALLKQMNSDTHSYRACVAANKNYSSLLRMTMETKEFQEIMTCHFDYSKFFQNHDCEYCAGDPRPLSIDCGGYGTQD